MSNLRKIGNKLFKETTELKSHEVELADDIQRLLSYTKGIDMFGKNIDISVKLVDDALRALKVDSSDLKADLSRVEKGLEIAETMSKDLGINPNQIPNYKEAKKSLGYASKQINKAKKYL